MTYSRIPFGQRLFIVLRVITCPIWWPILVTLLLSVAAMAYVAHFIWWFTTGSDSIKKKFCLTGFDHLEKFLW